MPLLRPLTRQREAARLPSAFWTLSMTTKRRPLMRALNCRAQALKLSHRRARQQDLRRAPRIQAVKAFLAGCFEDGAGMPPAAVSA